MTITSKDIDELKFTISPEGYDVSEVDAFLELVAETVDALNMEINTLGGKADAVDASISKKQGGTFVEPTLGIKSSEMKEKDERIAALEKELEDKKAEGNAIAQALIIAQRSADEIIDNANSKASQIVKDAQDDADDIRKRVENERQKVLDEIEKLETERENTRGEYSKLLKGVVEKATKQLGKIESEARPPRSRSDSSFVASTNSSNSTDNTATGQQVPISSGTSVSAYAVPQTTSSSAVAVAPVPTPSSIEKDLSGFGDAESDFEFDDID